MAKQPGSFDSFRTEHPQIPADQLIGVYSSELAAFKKVVAPAEPLPRTAADFLIGTQIDTTEASK